MMYQLKIDVQSLRRRRVNIWLDYLLQTGFAPLGFLAQQVEGRWVQPGGEARLSFDVGESLLEVCCVAKLKCVLSNHVLV